MEFDMEKKSNMGRARYPERITFQVTRSTKDGLRELADREYKGDIQQVGRQALQAVVDRKSASVVPLAGVPEALERMEGLLDRMYDTVSPLDSVLITIQQELSTLNTKIEEHSPDDQGLADAVKDLRPVLSNLTEAVASLR